MCVKCICMLFSDCSNSKQDLPRICSVQTSSVEADLFWSFCYYFLVIYKLNKIINITINIWRYDMLRTITKLMPNRNKWKQYLLTERNYSPNIDIYLYIYVDGRRMLRAIQNCGGVNALTIETTVNIQNCATQQIIPIPHRKYYYAEIYFVFGVHRTFHICRLTFNICEKSTHRQKTFPLQRWICYEKICQDVYNYNDDNST